MEYGHYGYQPATNTSSDTDQRRALSPPKRKQPAKISSVSSNNDDDVGYYGVASNNSSHHSSTNYYRSKSSMNSDDDFVPLSSTPKKKKQKTVDRGFEQSSDALAKRANRFKSQPENGISNPTTTNNDNVERYMGKALIGGGGANHGKTVLDEADYVQMTVKGACQKLEKEYLRLTAPPKAEMVRPKSVLQQHLTNLKIAWVVPSEKHTNGFVPNSRRFAKI
jgi:hypothetical protein